MERRPTLSHSTHRLSESASQTAVQHAVNTECLRGSSRRDLMSTTAEGMPVSYTDLTLPTICSV
eukprot:11661629-Alexandrium_andersonii.AAC.1